MYCLPYIVSSTRSRSFSRSDEKDILGLGVRKWTAEGETLPTKLYIHDEVKAGGAAARWNAGCGASEQIRPGLFISSVNSATTCDGMSLRALALAAIATQVSC